MRSMSAICALLTMVLAIPIAAAAEGGANPNQRTIQVAGNGEAQAAPSTTVG